jgi:Mixed lineage kinase domain-like N-terminal domain
MTISFGDVLKAAKAIYQLAKDDKMNSKKVHLLSEQVRGIILILKSNEKLQEAIKKGDCKAPLQQLIQSLKKAEQLIKEYQFASGSTIRKIEKFLSSSDWKEKFKNISTDIHHSVTVFDLYLSTIQLGKIDELLNEKAIRAADDADKLKLIHEAKQEVETTDQKSFQPGQTKQQLLAEMVKAESSIDKENVDELTKKLGAFTKQLNAVPESKDEKTATITVNARHAEGLLTAGRRVEGPKVKINKKDMDPKIMALISETHDKSQRSMVQLTEEHPTQVKISVDAEFAKDVSNIAEVLGSWDLTITSSSSSPPEAPPTTSQVRSRLSSSSQRLIPPPSPENESLLHPREESKKVNKSCCEKIKGWCSIT